MRIAKEVALRAAGDAEGVPQSQVVIAGRATGSVISGCVLEAAVQCDAGWLLLVTDDVPSEEFLSIYLVDHAGVLLDSARIGAPYATGSFGGLQLIDPATVGFRFIDNAHWFVDIHDKAQLGIPGLPDARGVWRGASLKRHFRIRRLDP